MEAELRAQLSEQGYIHEVLAEFGVEDAGVFDKDKVDRAMTYELYAYNELDFYQKQRCTENNIRPNMYNYPKGKRAHVNPFRTMGVDLIYPGPLKTPLNGELLYRTIPYQAA